MFLGKGGVSLRVCSRVGRGERLETALSARGRGQQKLRDARLVPGLSWSAPALPRAEPPPRGPRPRGSAAGRRQERERPEAGAGGVSALWEAQMRFSPPEKPKYGTCWSYGGVGFCKSGDSLGKLAATC